MNFLWVQALNAFLSEVAIAFYARKNPVGKEKQVNAFYFFVPKKGAFNVNYSQQSIVISAKEFANVIGVLYNHTEACRRRNEPIEMHVWKLSMDS